jgi:hypothetical protein
MAGAFESQHDAGDGASQQEAEASASQHGAGFFASPQPQPQDVCCWAMDP